MRPVALDEEQSARCDLCGTIDRVDCLDVCYQCGVLFCRNCKGGDHPPLCAECMESTKGEKE